MATKSRRADPPLERVLFEQAYRFDFFQAVRLFERLSSGRQPVGRGASPGSEAVRFRSHLSLSFPASEIQEITPAEEDGAPAKMTVTFMGLTGPLGVLPRHYTQLLLERVRRRDQAARDFLDLFNHRFISLFYRAWEKYRFPIAYERSVRNREGEDRFSHYLLDLVGMGTAGLLGHLKLQGRTLMFYAGLLARHCRSASALEGLLRDYFEAPVKVSQFTGEWLPIPEESRTRLGRANNALGLSTVAGTQFWDPQAKFTTEIGPVGVAQFYEFLPSGAAFRPLAQLIRFFAGQELDFDVQLTLRAAEVPACRLGGTEEHAPRLGWSTWLKTKEFAHDAKDAAFRDRSESQTSAFEGIEQLGVESTS